MKFTECFIFSMNNFTNINKRRNHLSPRTIEYKQTTTYDVENPGFEEVQNMTGGNRLMRSHSSPSNEITFLPL